ncbi:MAG: prohibitin family protein [Candidatus Omnitrophica bacterium]|nr:prohibitin family protein [Candidatus Omnitrophota bacterium]
MNIKTEEIKETMVVPSKEGLSVSLDVSILYRLAPELASDIYKRVGEGYREIAIVPQFRSVCRGVTVNYEAKALYTSSREEIALKIFTDLEAMLKERGIILERVLLRAITLPPTVSQAIEQKLKAEQEAEQMKFILEKEKKEAERKIIEAEGIAKAQEIIAQRLTDRYLTWRFMEKIEAFGKGQNNSIILLPYDQKILPLIQVPGEREEKK